MLLRSFWNAGGVLMAGICGVDVRARRWAALLTGLMAIVASGTALAENCSGRPDALGTSRTLVVDARAHPLIGTMQYRETLPLEDGEVVLTFDDGPLPKYTNQILDILAAQCVKATFFLVGRQAQANPEGVRRIRDVGHTIATHTQNHPSGMHKLPIERSTKDIEDGIASVKAALGDGSADLSPFFRIPGLARNDGIEEFTRAQGLQIWSADFPADDWRPVSSKRVHDLAMQRLKTKGKGILLLHDIQPRTVAALPAILRDLKAGGYRIVHVVPATAERPATPTEPIQWLLNPPSENVPIARWPKIPNFFFAATMPLAAPQLTESWWNDGAVLGGTVDRARRGQRSIPLPREPLWPRQVNIHVQVASADAASLPLRAPGLPVPAATLFDVQEGVSVAMRGVTSSAHRVEPTKAVQAEASPPAKPEAAAARKGRRVAAAKHGKRTLAGKPVHQVRAAAPAASKRAVPDKKNARRNGRNREARA
jgi:peptidoglycan/xylan/chitin deacetylase (PgdA/CDA1 family)